MKKFYLVARGTINEKFVNAPDTCDHLISYKGLIDPDYMGSAEFEFGSVPRFYRRVMQRIEADRNSYTIVNLQERIGLETFNKKPFWAFVYMPNLDEFLESMVAYVDDLKARDKIRSWRTKEHTAIDYHFDINTFKDLKRPDAWYCIDRIDKFSIGDWFMMVGDKNVPDAFVKVLMNDFQNWWLKLTDDERKKNYNRDF